jgi:Tol biopolymer transport system component
MDATGSRVQPLTTGDALDWRPAVSPDGARVAFTSNRGGARGVWIVPADGGTPRALAAGDVLDRVSWSPDSRRLVYALAADTGSTIWTVDADSGTPQQVKGITGRVPAWSPKGDSIAYVAATGGRPEIHFVTSGGATVQSPVSIEPVSLPTSIAWSPDGASIALVNLPGRAAAEVFVLSVGTGALRLLQRFAAPAELDGVTWSPDGKSVLVGRRVYESEVLLIRGLKHAPRP